MPGGSINIIKTITGTLSVTITRASAGSLTVYSDAAFTSAVSFPDAITASKRYYLNTDDDYVISVKRNGFEIAAEPDGTQSVRITGGKAYSIEPRVSPDSTLAAGELTGTPVLGATGIGITPSSNSGLAVTPALSVSNDAGDGVAVYRGAADANGVNVQFHKTRNTTVTSHTVLANGDSLGTVRFYGSDGAAWRQAVLVKAVVDGTPGSSDMPGALSIYTSPDGSASVVERLKVDNAGLITGTGTSLGAWTSYTPTLGGFAIGNGTATGAYCQVGKTVHFRARVVMGSTTTFGGVPTVTVPINGLVGYGGHHVRGIFKDASTGLLYPAISDPSTGYFTLYATDTSGTYAVMSNTSSTVPFTWTTSDEIRIFGTYEIG